jgi:N-acetylmuramoyl-L-alanine amidase/Fibronectin type III domain
MRPKVLALGLLVVVGFVSSDSTAGASTVPPRVAKAPATSSSAVTAFTPDDSAPVGSVESGTGVLASPDYSLAGWAPAASTNFTVSDRPVSYMVNMIVIHSTEGSYTSAKTAFQNPSRHGSAHYVVSRTGRIAQMVLEKDVAWHAGNWDYNTRAIGIEHEGYAGKPGSFTLVEYRASAHIAAAICSRWGVPLNRQHVIGHYQVPDPYNPALGGGAEHHWDPGLYWNWSYYLNKARAYASGLPSLPHMGPAPTAVSGVGGITLSWKPAQSCTAPITGYSVVGQPGNISLTVPASTTSVWIPGLTDGVGYSFTVTATNAKGHSSLTSNTAIVGRPCDSASLTANPSPPQPPGTTIQFTAGSTICNSPEYAFLIMPPGGNWSVPYRYGGPAWSWDSTGRAPGIYQFQVWARQEGSGRAWDAYAITTISLGTGGCQYAGLTPAAPSPQVPGTQVTFNASSGCDNPEYQFGVMPPGGTFAIKRPYGGGATWTWDTSGLAPGMYQVAVWARQVGSTAAYAAYFVTSYQLRVS